MKQKEYIKISFNTTKEIAEELERLKDTSESFGPSAEPIRCPGCPRLASGG